MAFGSAVRSAFGPSNESEGTLLSDLDFMPRHPEGHDGSAAALPPSDAMYESAKLPSEDGNGMYRFAHEGTGEPAELPPRDSMLFSADFDFANAN